MHTAFDYACNQLFDMRFEAFTMTTGGRRYVWRGGLAGTVCAVAYTVGLTFAARWVFERFVEVG